METESGVVVSGEAFERVIANLDVKHLRNGDAMAHCPVHDDTTASLHVTRTESSVMLKCFGACTTKEIIDELGLNWSDLFDVPNGQKRPPKRPDEWYEYQNESGTVIYLRCRYDEWNEAKHEYRKTFRPYHSDRQTVGMPEEMPHVLYRLPKVIKAVREGTTVYLVEGEKDVHALEAIGLIATTVGSASNWGAVARNAREVLHGAIVVIIIDRDVMGRKLAKQEAEGLEGIAASVTVLEPTIGNDISDHLAAGKSIDDLVPFDQGEDEDQEEDDHPWRPPFDWHALFNTESEAEFLVDGLWPVGRSIAIHAMHKTGKSLVALYVAAKLAIGEDPFTGMKREPIRVAYLDDEMTPDDIRDRLEAMAFDAKQLENLIYRQYSGIRDLDTRKGGEMLMDMLRTDQAQAAFLDTIGRYVGGEENSNDTFRQYHLYSGTLMKREGISSCRLDHEGHNKEYSRGASAKGDDIDIDWRLMVTDSGFKLKRQLTRVPGIPESIDLEQHDDPLRWTAGPSSWPEGTKQKANELILAKVPLDAGREIAKRMLKDAGFTPGKNEVLSAALKYRREPTTMLLHGN